MEDEILSLAQARGARAELRLGDSSFLVRAEDPASEVNASLLAGVDWNAQVFNGGSFAAHAVVLFLVFLVPPNLKHLGLDAFNTMHKLVDYRSTAKDLSQEEVPPWISVTLVWLRVQPVSWSNLPKSLRPCCSTTCSP